MSTRGEVSGPTKPAKGEDAPDTDVPAAPAQPQSGTTDRGAELAWSIWLVAFILLLTVMLVDLIAALFRR